MLEQGSHQAQHRSLLGLHGPLVVLQTRKDVHVDEYTSFQCSRPSRLPACLHVTSGFPNLQVSPPVGLICRLHHALTNRRRGCCRIHLSVSCAATFDSSRPQPWGRFCPRRGWRVRARHCRSNVHSVYVRCTRASPAEKGESARLSGAGSRCMRSGAAAARHQAGPMAFMGFPFGFYRNSFHR